LRQIVHNTATFHQFKIAVNDVSIAKYGANVYAAEDDNRRM